MSSDRVDEPVGQLLLELDTEILESSTSLLDVLDRDGDVTWRELERRKNESQREQERERGRGRKESCELIKKLERRKERC